MGMLVTERSVKARLDFHKRLLQRHTQQSIDALLGGRPSLSQRYIDLTHHDLAQIEKLKQELEGVSGNEPASTDV